MTKISTMKPFAPGDIFLGCTYLCNPDDDHAGEGRILQYDRNMVPKGTLYTDGTTHLVVNLRFGPDGVLWGFDGFAHAVVRVAPTGEQMPAHDFGDRAWGSVCFGHDGSIFLTEYLHGVTPYQGGDMRTLPGTNVVGYGRIAKFDSALNKVTEFETDLSPSMTGFHGVTHSAMHPDGRHMAFMIDLGMRVMRIDTDSGELLPDLIHYPGGEEYVRKWTTGVAYLKDGTLCLLRGSFIDFIDADGQSLRTIELDEYGYAMITVSADDRFAYLTNIFTGVMSKVDLDSGAIVGAIDTGMAKPSRSLAGVAVYPD
ncbi:MAG: hypothetical protein QGH93_05135 [Gammaproteobacteria bacterium]|jgi:hypothetical protein|nr:hypothetical protein [Chromatiales bacterium]MDP6674221.1 hypothetical protein [Gammaproteobacteria bacterium]